MLPRTACASNSTTDSSAGVGHYTHSSAGREGNQIEEWNMYSQFVSGEWDGVSVTFGADGTARELPEYYVPEAYRDWDVTLYDWQTQCSMNCDENSMYYTSRKLMPTVGCEADAIAFTENSCSGFDITNPDFFFSGQGLSTCAPGACMSNDSVFDCKFDHIITLSEDKRMRFVHLMKRMGAERQWKVQGIEVHLEKRDGPFTGKRELSGCGGGMNGFAMNESLDVETLESMSCWIVSEGNSRSKEGDLPKSWSLPSSATTIGLPLNCWTCFNVDNSNPMSTHIMLQVGVWDPDTNQVRVATQESQDGSVINASLLTATAQ